MYVAEEMALSGIFNQMMRGSLGPSGYTVSVTSRIKLLYSAGTRAPTELGLSDSTPSHATGQPNGSREEGPLQGPGRRAANEDVH